MINSDWAKGPLVLSQQSKSPFDYSIHDADGNLVHEEQAISNSSDWDTVEDMLELKGIRDGTCGLARKEWKAQIEQQRAKLRFLAQSEDIICGH